MRGFLPRALATLAGALLLTLPAHAVTNGDFDDGNHPAVGHVFGTFLDPNGNPFPTTGCTGVLIAEEVFLTSGECASIFEDSLAGGFLDAAWVTFDPLMPSSTTFNRDKAVPVVAEYVNPAWPGGGTQAADNANDVGVLLLDGTGAGPDSFYTDALGGIPALPAPSLLDTLDTGQLYTVVAMGAPRNGFPTEQTRNSAAAVLVNTTDNFGRFRLLLTDNHTMPCIAGESEAGPAYIGDGLGSPEIVALAINPNRACEPVTNFQRLDIDGVLPWLQSFLAP